MRPQERTARDDVKKGRFPSTPLLDAVLLDAVLLLAVAACHHSGSTLTVSGTVEIRDLQLAALTSGRLQRLFKDEGDTVRRGDTVAVLTQPGPGAPVWERRAPAPAAALPVAQRHAGGGARARAPRALGRTDGHG